MCDYDVVCTCVPHHLLAAARTAQRIPLSREINVCEAVGNRQLIIAKVSI
jgi:hypothetical protein